MITIQLLIVVTDNNPENSVLNQVVEHEIFFDKVDILYFTSRDNPNYNFVRKNYKYLNKDFTIHYCYESLETAINQFVSDDYTYYVVVSNPDRVLPTNFISTVKQLGQQKLLAIRSQDEAFDGFMTYTKIHRQLEGFGTQKLTEKIDIDSINREYSLYVYDSIDTFMNDVLGDDCEV